jgi:hypothetical protein
MVWMVVDLDGCWFGWFQVFLVDGLDGLLVWIVVICKFRPYGTYITVPRK